MKIKLMTATMAGAVALAMAVPAAAADNEKVCQHPSLTATDQLECTKLMKSAMTESDKARVRSMFEARANQAAKLPTDTPPDTTPGNERVSPTPDAIPR